MLGKYFVNFTWTIQLQKPKFMDTKSFRMNLVIHQTQIPQIFSIVTFLIFFFIFLFCQFTLRCYEHVNQIVHCPAANEQCILSFYANGQNVKQGCHKINSNISSDFEFILTSNEDAVVNFQNTLPYHVEGEVLCSSNLCNSRERYNQVIYEFFERKKANTRLFIQLVARILSLYTQSSEFFNPPAITMQESETTLSTLTKQTVTSTRTTTTQSTTSIARRNQNPLNVPNSQSASSDAKRYINPSILIMIATFITLKIFP